MIVPFHISTIILVTEQGRPNSTPVFALLPLQLANTGQVFVHNPGAFDPDGDSLAYRLVEPQQARTQPVPQYVYPNDAGFGAGTVGDPSAPAEFFVNELSGTVTWNAPAMVGEYTIALVVEEWRDGIKLSEVTQDIQIIVGTFNNRPPEAPDQVGLLIADRGEVLIDTTFKATDPDGDEVILTTPQSNTGVYDKEQFNSSAGFSYDEDQQEAHFRWEIDCEHVREQPYVVVFAARDIPEDPSNFPLTDIAAWIIRVKARALENLNAEADEQAVLLNWAEYQVQCPDFTLEQVEEMRLVVWRKPVCQDTVLPTQNLRASGFEEVAELPINATSYQDEGPWYEDTEHAYAVTVRFPGPAFGSSIASNLQCIQPPLITTSLDEKSFARHINVFPNPTEGKINIKINEAQAGQVVLQIRNTKGEVLEEIKAYKEAGDWEKTLSVLEDQPRGVYCLLVQWQGKVVVKTILK